MLDENNEQGQLSHYFNKKLIKNRKLNLFGKAISTIDLIAIHKHQVYTLVELDLSHNTISQLTNLSQFKELQILNISHNKIEQQEQLQKLFMLPHLHSLYLKNNPIFKSTPSIGQLKFLLGLNTDVIFISNEVEQKINTLVTKTQLFDRYIHYYKKIKLHFELFKEKAALIINSHEISNSLPKINRLFQESSFADKTLRKYIVNQLDSSLFQKPNDLLAQLEKLIKNVKKKVSQTIIQINQLFLQLSTKKRQNFQNTKIFKSGKITSQIPQSFKPLRQKQKIKHAVSQIKLSPNRSVSMQKSFVRREKSTFETNIQSSNIKLSDFQAQFKNILTKVHPSFQLLHSPVTSLKTHEKDLLIEQLLSLLKDSMKSNIKLKNVNSQNTQLKEQIKQLKKHLEDLTIQISEHTKNLNYKIKELQASFEQQFERAQLLQMQSRRRLLENELQRQMIEKYKEQTKVKNNQNQLLLKDIQHYETISQLRSNGIKKKYLHILAHRAQQYTKMKKLRDINQKTHHNYMKFEVLYSLKMSIFLNYYQKKLEQKNKLRYVKNLLIKNHDIIQARLCQKQLMNSLKSLRVKQFLQKLNIFKFQVHSRKLNFQVCSNRYKFLKITKCFKTIKNNIFTKLSERQQKKASNHRKCFLLESVISLWNKYIHMFKENQQRCQREYILNSKSSAIKDFVHTMQYETSINSKKIALNSFLPNIRKIKGYLTISKKLSQIILKRSINVSKIKLLKKNLFFQFFISAMKDRIIKKGLKKQREKELKKVQQKQLQIQLHSVLEQKKQRKRKFANQIALVAYKLRIKIIKRHISNSILQEQVANYKMTRFISKLRSFYIHHLRINKKIAQIESYRFTMLKCRKFFSVLRRIQQFKSNQRKKLRVLKMKVFYSWKIMFNQNSLIILRQRYDQLQNEVGILKQKQLKSQQQKQTIFKKLDQKDLLYHQCMKKTEELTYLLESNEIKYENLKGIFNDTLKMNQYYRQKIQPLKEQLKNSNLTPSKSKFLKCIEHQIKKDLTSQLYKPQINKDRFLYQKDRNIEFKHKLSINQTRQKFQQQTKAFSFVSSFKRF